jgi:hypothetical protein
MDVLVGILFLIFVVSIIWRLANKKKLEEKLGKKLSGDEYDKYVRDEKRAQRRAENKKRAETPEAIEARRREQEAKEQLEKDMEQYIQKLKEGNYPNVPFRLVNGEKAYYKVYSTAWKELRTKRHSVSYGHIQQRIKIAKGLSFRVGNIKPKVHTSQELEAIDRGDFFLTNKKILFIGQNTKKIDLNKILKFEYDGDLTIIRDSGKNVVIPMDTKDAVIISNIVEKIDKGEL